MEGEGGGMMEGEGGGWCGRGMEGEHWNSLTCARCRVHPSSSVGGRCVRGCSSFVGDRCHPEVGHRPCLLVGRRPRALEGCAGGGARRPSWFQRVGLSVVVGVRMGGGSSLPVGHCRSWVCGWGIIVVGRGSLSVCACGRCWWWRSSPVVVERRVAVWWW